MADKFEGNKVCSGVVCIINLVETLSENIRVF